MYQQMMDTFSDKVRRVSAREYVARIHASRNY